MQTYKIVRFYKNGQRSRVIERGVSLEYAQKHCNDPKTSTATYFDGFEKE